MILKHTNKTIDVLSIDITNSLKQFYFSIYKHISIELVKGYKLYTFFNDKDNFIQIFEKRA
jgi:hypothetical protein